MDGEVVAVKKQGLLAQMCAACKKDDPKLKREVEMAMTLRRLRKKR